MIKNGFTINECDKCVYTKIIENTCIIVCFYVVDMLILETSTEVIKSTKKTLSKKIDMKDQCVVDVLLKIKITKTPDEISLSQLHYMGKMIERFKEHEIKGNANPFLSYPPSQEYKN